MRLGLRTTTSVVVVVVVTPSPVSSASSSGGDLQSRALYEVALRLALRRHLSSSRRVLEARGGTGPLVILSTGDQRRSSDIEPFLLYVKERKPETCGSREEFERS